MNVSFSFSSIAGWSALRHYWCIPDLDELPISPLSSKYFNFLTMAQISEWNLFSSFGLTCIHGYPSATVDHL